MGRLTTIYEDPNGLNYQTNYFYDVLGNLRRVQQGDQERYFMYDALSRLVRARNPEQQTNAAYATAPDPISGNAAWSLAYAYDDNSNLTLRQDPRGVTATYAYDALNRNTTATYSDGTPAATLFYDGAGIANGVGRLWKAETSGATATRTQFNGFDAYGSPLSQTQQFYYNSAWSAAYTVSRSYNLAGGVTSQTYPSGHSVSYGYDAVGRLQSFAGNLGDGTQRTYTTGLAYSSWGKLAQEQYGTTTPVYNKLFYNVRGQLAEIRLSTTPTDTSWNRGAIINHYSNQCWGQCSGQSMTDNNGNLKKQDVYIPHDDQISNYTAFGQAFDYDSLNRLQRVSEYNASLQTLWQQEYVYDRWGNRTVSQSNTWGTGIPKPNFSVDPANNNRLIPASGVMSYDAAGNVVNDTYTGQGARNYDAENRMVSAWANNQWQSYVYDAAGQRVRRVANGAETWQVYGLGGELLAEYAENGSATSPQKEYGYRGGQLLVTAEPNANTDNVQWLVADHLGTPRMIMDRTGSLSGVKRSDYLPFGEEIGANVGVRTTGLGYVADNVRQGYTGHEKDDETGLNFAQARYYASGQGRFTSVDPLMASATPGDPRSWNRYAYVFNNPLNFTDPSGMRGVKPGEIEVLSGTDGQKNIAGITVGNWNQLTAEQQRLFTTYFESQFQDILQRPFMMCGELNTTELAGAYWDASVSAANANRTDAGSFMGRSLLDQSQLTTFLGVTGMWEKTGVIGKIASVTEIRGAVKPDGFSLRGRFRQGGGAYILKNWNDIPGKVNDPYTTSRRHRGYYDEPNGQFKLTAGSDPSEFQSDVDYNSLFVKVGFFPTPKPNAAHTEEVNGMSYNSDIRFRNYLERHTGKNGYGAVPITRIKR